LQEAEAAATHQGKRDKADNRSTRNGRRPATTNGRTERPTTTTTPRTTKDANQPSNVQRTRDQGQGRSVRQMESAQRTPNGKGMRDKKKQDCKLGHATLGKAATDDGKNQGRNSSRTTKTALNKSNNAYIITDHITKDITGSITSTITHHVTVSITSTNKEIQQARQSRRKPTGHQRTHAAYGTSTDISGIGFIQEYEAGPEILGAAVTQENTSDDNANGKKQARVEVCLEETRKNGGQSAERLRD
jgi:hypothetical protein